MHASWLLNFLIKLIFFQGIEMVSVKTSRSISNSKEVWKNADSQIRLSHIWETSSLTYTAIVLNWGPWPIVRIKKNDVDLEINQHYYLMISWLTLVLCAAPSFICVQLPYLNLSGLFGSLLNLRLHESAVQRIITFILSF